MIEAGVSAVRINMSHGSQNEHTATISNARAALAQALIGQSAFDGCWPELTVFESARAYPARHAAILLPFDAVLVAMTGGN